MKQTIRLNEAQLKRVVAESVKRVLKENFEDLRKIRDELDSHLLKAKDLANELLSTAFSSNDSSAKFYLGYATTVKNALESLRYEKLDNKEFDSETIYPKGSDFGGFAPDVYDNC